MDFYLGYYIFWVWIFVVDVWKLPLSHRPRRSNASSASCWLLGLHFSNHISGKIPRIQTKRPPENEPLMTLFCSSDGGSDSLGSESHILFFGHAFMSFSGGSFMHALPSGGHTLFFLSLLHYLRYGIYWWHCSTFKLWNFLFSNKTETFSLDEMVPEF